MKIYTTLLCVIILICTSILIFKFVNPHIGVSVFITGLTVLMYLSLKKTDNGTMPSHNLPKYLIPEKTDTEELVVAMCNEDVSWIDEHAHKYKLVTVYNKCGKVVKFKSPNVKVIESPNIGTCDHAYLSYIIERYDSLPTFIEFTKGWRPPKGEYHNCLPCKTDKEKHNELMSFSLKDYNFSNPVNSHKKGLSKFQTSKYNNMGEWVKDSEFLTEDIYKRNTCNMIYGGQFGATKEQIINTPKKVWEHLRSQQKYPRAEVDHFIERTWRPLLCEYKYNRLTDMLKYAIYFPQFHQIRENDINFYNGYTDIINLRDLIIHKKETPSHIELPLTSINDYDYVKNKNLIQSQIELLKKYDIDGFATYHYWFSDNTITGNKMIMENINNNLLNSDLGDKKIFYIWANEDWTSSVLTNNKKTVIKNNYDDVNIMEHCQYLMSVFSNPGYLKFDNKPVFLIHHLRMISNSIISKYYNILNKLCKEYNFDGIYLRINSDYKNIEDIPENIRDKCYDLHPQYKNPDKYTQKGTGISYVDYKKYVDELNLYYSDIQSIFFDFDNSARLLYNKKDRKPTKCVNNTEEEYKKYFNKIKEKVPKILLINAWNEWGEKMHIEPSNEKGNYYLELINNHLNFSKIPKIIHKVFIGDNDIVLLNNAITKTHNSWLKYNKGYELKLWAKNECREYLINNFEKDVIDTFVRLIPYAYKTDFFRYCVIYMEGGWYSDWSQECFEFNLLERLERDRKHPLVTFKDRCGYKLDHTKNNNYINNGFFGAPKGHFILKEIIQKIIHNVKINYYGENRLLPTGPGLFGNIFCKYYSPVIENYYESNFYYIEETQIIKSKCDWVLNNDFPMGNSYRELWKKKKIYANTT
uniref:Uncharacterized protein n=1 Tax=viral metagenome TaxID=1070528 RepID=A0A6C0JQ38_9ZZZZ